MSKANPDPIIYKVDVKYDPQRHVIGDESYCSFAVELKDAYSGIDKIIVTEKGFKLRDRAAGMNREGTFRPTKVLWLRRLDWLRFHPDAPVPGETTLIIRRSDITSEKPITRYTSVLLPGAGRVSAKTVTRTVTTTTPRGQSFAAIRRQRVTAPPPKKFRKQKKAA